MVGRGLAFASAAAAENGGDAIGWQQAGTAGFMPAHRTWQFANGLHAPEYGEAAYGRAEVQVRCSCLSFSLFRVLCCCLSTCGQACSAIRMS